MAWLFPGNNNETFFLKGDCQEWPIQEVVATRNIRKTGEPNVLGSNLLPLQNEVPYLSHDKSLLIRHGS